MIHKAIEKLIGFSRRHGIGLRQSLLRAAKRAMITAERYTHAHQFQRANREHKLLRSRLGRLIHRHQPQDRRRSGSQRTIGAVARVGRQSPLPEPAPERAEDLFPACVGGRVHQQGKARGLTFGCKVPIATRVGQPKARQGPARQSL